MALPDPKIIPSPRIIPVSIGGFSNLAALILKWPKALPGTIAYIRDVDNFYRWVVESQSWEPFGNGATQTPFTLIVPLGPETEDVTTIVSIFTPVAFDCTVTEVFLTCSSPSTEEVFVEVRQADQAGLVIDDIIDGEIELAADTQVSESAPLNLTALTKKNFIVAEVTDPGTNDFTRGLKLVINGVRA